MNEDRHLLDARARRADHGVARSAAEPAGAPAAARSRSQPGNFVTWGDRAADEMAHAWVGVTTLTQEDYDRLVAERQARRSVSDN